VTMEPKPIKPSSGSGEAVCGSLPFASVFWAVVLLSAAAAFWSELAAFWSLLLCAEAALLSAGAAPVELVADWSAEGVVEAAADWSLLGVVLVADWSAEGVVLAEAEGAALELEADWSAEGVVLAEAEGVVLEAPAVADWSADGVEAEAEPAGVVAEAEAEGEALLEAVWLLLSLPDGAEACGGVDMVLPVPVAAAAVVSAVGFAPLSPLGAADCTGALLLVCPVVEADWSEFGMLLAEAEGAAAPEGAAPLAVVVVVVVVCAASPEAGAAAEAPLVLQESEIIFASLTLNLLSEPIVPVKEAWCPTWASSPLPSNL
jgi:hypothetical protein